MILRSYNYPNGQACTVVTYWLISLSEKPKPMLLWHYCKVTGIYTDILNISCNKWTVVLSEWTKWLMGLQNQGDDAYSDVILLDKCAEILNFKTVYFCVGVISNLEGYKMLYGMLYINLLCGNHWKMMLYFSGWRRTLKGAICASAGKSLMPNFL